jgi:high-affinity iron transporter
MACKRRFWSSVSYRDSASLQRFPSCGLASRRAWISRLLKVTALFLAVFLLQLIVYGVHELAESGVIHGSQAFHDATELFGPDGSVGQALSHSLVAAPVLYLIFERDKRRSRHTPLARA